MNDFHADIDMSAVHAMMTIAPKETRRAAARYLNDVAFSDKSILESVIASRYIIRNAAFVRAMIRVEKADPSDAPSQQVAIAGSIRTNRFTGWIEALDGREPERHRVVGENARSGDIKKKVAQSNRLLPGLTFESPDNYDEIPERMRIPAMLSILARNPDYTADGKGMFIIRGGNWVPGVYKFKNKGQTAKWRKSRKGEYSLVDKRARDVYDRPAVQRVQSFEHGPVGQRYNWPGIAIARLMAYFNPRDVWARYFGEIIRKAGGKK